MSNSEMIKKLKADIQKSINTIEKLSDAQWNDVAMVCGIYRSRKEQIEYLKERIK